MYVYVCTSGKLRYQCQNGNKIVDFGGEAARVRPPKSGNCYHQWPCIYQFLPHFPPKFGVAPPIFLTSLRQWLEHRWHTCRSYNYFYGFNPPCPPLLKPIIVVISLKKYKCANKFNENSPEIQISKFFSGC